MKYTEAFLSLSVYFFFKCNWNIIQGSFHVKQDLVFECLDVMTAVAEDGLDGLNGELTLLDENFRNRPAHFTKEDKDRLLVLRTFLSPLNRGERSENSGNPAEELDLFLQMLSVAPLLDHLTTAGADTEADYLDQLKKAPDVSSRYAFDDDAHDDAHAKALLGCWRGN